MHTHILYTDYTSINPNKNFQVAVPSRISHGIRALDGCPGSKQL